MLITNKGHLKFFSLIIIRDSLRPLHKFVNLFLQGSRSDIGVFEGSVV
jgi:hypothetical protein